MSSKNRRTAKRVPIKVLVKCLPAKSPTQRNGHPTRGLDLWVKDIAHDGVGLLWSKQWAYRLCTDCTHYIDPLSPCPDRCLCNQTSDSLQKGQEVKLDGLVYTDEGSHPVSGRIQWVRPGKKGDFYVGVQITSPHHRQHFHTLEHV